MTTLANNEVKAFESKALCMVLTNGMSENNHENIAIGRGGKLKLTIVNKIEEVEGSQHELKITQQEDSQLELIVVYLGKGCHKEEVTITLEGDGAMCKVQSAYLIDHITDYEMDYSIYHRGKRTVSDVVVKGALLDQAKKSFNGNLYFERGAKGSKGSEVEQALLLSHEAKSYAIPALWCDEEDIVGNHAASSGKLSEEKLFYLMSRGLSEEEGRYLMVEAAIRPILDQIEEDQLRESLSDELNRRMGK